MNTTRDQLIAEILKIAIEAPKGLRKMRKAELEELLASMRHELAREELLAEQAAEARVANGTEPDGDIEDVAVAKQEAELEELRKRAMLEEGAADLAATAVQVGDALHRQLESYELTRRAERAQLALQSQVATNAWRDRPVQVTSMGRSVRGHVVAVTLREQARVGYTGYEFLMAVQHEGHATRRTLHAFSDIKLLAS